MKGLNGIAYVLVIIGALNWGLVGLGGFMNAEMNVVKMVLGAWPAVESLVYVLVGLSAVVLLVNRRSSAAM